MSACDTLDSRATYRLIRHLQNDTTDLLPAELEVPVEHFTCEARARAEIGLLKTLPLVVAISTEIGEIGDFITRAVMGIPLLITRGRDGHPAVYLNSCLHRGGRVEQTMCGNRSRFQCQHHGWSYDTDGSLMTVPHERSYGNIDRENCGLRTFEVQERFGLIFVRLTPGLPSTCTDDMPDEVGRQIDDLNLAKSVICREETFSLEMNWKLALDGAIDLLHTQFLHASSVGQFFKSNVSSFELYGSHARHWSPNKKLVELARTVGRDVQEGATYTASTMLLYPNVTIVPWQDHVEMWVVWPSPTTPLQSIVHIRSLVREDRVNPDVERRVEKSWALLKGAILDEDWPMARSIQENATAWTHGSFTYGRSEALCQHFHRRLDGDVRSLESQTSEHRQSKN